MSDILTLAATIAARQDAEALFSLAGEQPPRFWEVLAGLVNTKLPPKPAQVDRNPPMNDQEAIRFEAEPLPYGKHAGTLVGVVDVGYLLFLTEGDEFSKRLRRYVKSQRFQSRQVDDE
jgi:hypothetical protein